VDSILRSQGGHGRAVLEMLAEHGGPISRRAVRERLEITESHLSHVLRDLAEADLIVRSRLGREVALDLGPVGREVVERSVAPAWVSYLCDRIKHISSLELRIEPETLTAELLRRGAPSRTVARQLAEAVLQWPNELTPRARQNALFLVARCDMQVNLSVPRRALFARTKAGSR
jgi:DNA-binding MarR family transcriptional regulator